ncbi:MAG: hypothetical protein JF888_10690 [Candidatus Dormibacteraeota bacterium]|uniref:UmuC domain-containing protein n=1 Tax=Candidatus Dormiibacter inghamiae TaxID=3127013 RepID=A0A934KF76_9BACT|nr:hypothetical protein [Candidatus Dormibacteraeota bacterium]MBJ7607338.1 hypothetical protein [Candidatus Dormibacteraeota bacterium]
MAVCCCLVPDLELALHPALRGGPVIVSPAGEPVQACSPEARSAGVLPGQTPAQAEALCPAATFVKPQPEATARLANRLASALYDLAPVVQVRQDGRVWLGLDGVPKLGQAIAETRRRLEAVTGWNPRLGLAPGPFSAALAAAGAAPGRVLRVENAAAFLAPLPIRELDLESEQFERLELLGLRTLGQLAAIGPCRLESQLGKAGRTAVLLARGEEPLPLKPWRPAGVMSAHRQLEPPVEDREALLFIARTLAADLAQELGWRGAGAKRLRLRVNLDGIAEPLLRESLVRHPLSSAAELFGLAGAWIRELQLTGPEGAVELALEVPELEGAGRRQLRLWLGGDRSAEEVEAALERLQERYGAEMTLSVQPALPASPLVAQRFSLVAK